MIQVEALRKRFGEIEALRDISFSIGSKEVVGLLGPNGAGKTTAMRIIAGYMPPDSGVVTLEGYRIPGQSMDVRRRIGYLPEQVALYPDMTTTDYLHYMAAIRDVPRHRRREAVNSVVDRCGLETVSHRVIKGLSKGFRQRVGLAQAIVHEPAMVVLDEPTVGLDPKQILEVRNLIQDLGREHTVILSSHILSEVSATCQRIIIIHQGAVVAEDTTKGLSARLEGALPVRLEIRGPFEAIRSFLFQVEDSEMISVHAVDDGVNDAEMRLPADPAVRERLAAAVIARGWGLQSMTTGGASLEDVFLTITQENEQ